MPIFDQGYQHWSGTLSGHAWRWLAITRQGVRIGFKNRYLRMVLLLAWLPALALVAILCMWGLVERNSELIVPFLGFLERLFGNEVVQDPRHYRVEVWTICYHYFLLAELRFSMLLILLVGPNLISQDLRFNALPLYFSRPLRRIDYFLGKLGVITVFLGMIVIVPSMIAYVLGLLFSLDITIIRDTYRLLLASVAYGVVISVSAGLLILALSSLSRNSRYVALFWLAVLMVSGIVATVLDSVDRQQRARAFYSNNGIARMDRSAEDLVAEEMEASKSNWRPLVSYTANLSRVGQSLLGTDGCWEKISQSWRPRERLRFLSTFVGPQFPWYWSASVLAALLGLSAWILNFQIKSLDRLK
jgi:ABC-2 type transport system permease protein